MTWRLREAHKDPEYSFGGQSGISRVPHLCQERNAEEKKREDQKCCTGEQAFIHVEGGKTPFRVPPERPFCFFSPLLAAHVVLDFAC